MNLLFILKVFSGIFHIFNILSRRIAFLNKRLPVLCISCGFPHGLGHGIKLRIQDRRELCSLFFHILLKLSAEPVKLS